MIIAIAGPIGSGKTTLARALADCLGAKTVGFGDFVRSKARAQGLGDSDRQVLQDLGNSLVIADAAGFLDEALHWAGHKTGDDLLLDGLRHSSVWEALAARQPQGLEPVKLVFVDVHEHERHRRLLERGLTPAEIATAEAHPAERDVNLRLRAEADLLLSGAILPEEMAAMVIASLAESAKG
jgi:dephospho-CoA kinase